MGVFAHKYDMSRGCPLLAALVVKAGDMKFQAHKHLEDAKADVANLEHIYHKLNLFQTIVLHVS